MPNSNPPDLILTKIRVLQCIALAIVLGAVVFAGVIFSLVDWEQVEAQTKMLPVLGALTGMAMFGLTWLVPQLVSPSDSHLARQALTQNSDPPSDDVFAQIVMADIQTRYLIFYAILEAALFLNLMVFHLELSTISLTIIGIAFAMMLLGFPTTGRVLRTIEKRIDDIKRESQLLS